jgi:hypothetical protein
MLIALSHLNNWLLRVVAPVDGARTVTKPASVELSRGDPHSISFHKDGYQDQVQKLTSSESGWVVGNLLLGGIAGAVSDESSGASKKLSTDAVSVTLVPVLAPSQALFAIRPLLPSPC